MNASRQSIGLIGLGLLGTALAERLLGVGYEVVGFDIDRACCKNLDTLGGCACEGAEGVFQRCDIVLLSLPTSEVVRELMNQVSSALREDHIIVDTTTGDPKDMLAIGDTLGGRGVDYVEATVAGSSDQLRSGDAVLFVGGEPSAIERIKPLLDAITKKFFLLGPVGAASRFKLVHNLILGLHRAVLAEGLTFAQALGFDTGQTLEILQETPAASKVMETKGRRMVEGDYTPQARLSQHLKDVQLILAEAERAGATTPLSETHRELLRLAEQIGFGAQDNSAVIEAYRQKQGG